jgi:tRNA G18 (ribose-2'-O)-methylase SpoU
VVLEGRLVISRALARADWRVTRLLLTPPAEAALRSVLADTPDKRRPAVELVTPDELSAVGGVRFHQGCLGYADRPASRRWDDLPLDHAPGGRTVVVVLDDVRDPDNVGSIFRTALAFGVTAVLLAPGCADPLYRKTIRTSMAAVMALPFAAAEPWPGVLDALRARGFLLVATTPDAGADDLGQAVATMTDSQDVSQPVALLVGSEGAGLSPAALARADRRVRIPVTSAVDSLNVAAATAIVLYALRAS